MRRAGAIPPRPRRTRARLAAARHFTPERARSQREHDSYHRGGAAQLARLGDRRGILPLHAGSADLVVTDPSYNIASRHAQIWHNGRVTTTTDSRAARMSHFTRSGNFPTPVSPLMGRRNPKHRRVIEFSALEWSLGSRQRVAGSAKPAVTFGNLGPNLLGRGESAGRGAGGRGA